MAGAMGTMVKDTHTFCQVTKLPDWLAKEWGEPDGTLPAPFLRWVAQVWDPTTWTILQNDGPNHLGLLLQRVPRASNGPNHLELCALQMCAFDGPMLQKLGGRLAKPKSR